MAVLLASHLRYDLEQPRALGNDQLIFSKGHAAPLLYALLKAAGAISDAQLMTLRKRGSVIEGHPRRPLPTVARRYRSRRSAPGGPSRTCRYTWNSRPLRPASPRLPYVEVATGSLGQGLAAAVGMALAAKRLDRAEDRFWVLLGARSSSPICEGPSSPIDTPACEPTRFKVACEIAAIRIWSKARVKKAANVAANGRQPRVCRPTMMRTVHDSVVLYPCCANATAELVEEMAARDGIQYLRTTREKTAVLYPPTEEFPVGGCKVLRRSDCDHLGIVAAGITVHEALKAYERLRARGVMTRIVDLYSVKPVDRAMLREAARECSGGLLVVEDHHPEGGLADAVAEAFEGIGAPTMRRLGVRSMPGSATPKEQLSLAGIDANAIVEFRHCWATATARRAHGLRPIGC